MEEFVDIYRENRKEAMELFFLPNFEKVFLEHLPEPKELISQSHEEQIKKSYLRRISYSGRI